MYCFYLDQLEQKIKEKINPDFKDRVSLQEESDVFVGYATTLSPSVVSFSESYIVRVISAAIQILTRELDAVCEPAFNEMKRTTWSTLSLVSGQSGYMDELIKAMEQFSDIVKPLIEQKKYLKNLFDKMSRYV